MPANKFVKQWRNQHDNEIRSRDKMKQKEYLEKRWGGNLLPPPRDQKDPEMSSVISLGSNMTETSTYQKEQRIINYEPNISEITTIQRLAITQYEADIPKEVLDNIPTFDSKQGELKPVFEHNRIPLNNVQSMQNRLSAIMFQRKSTRDH